MKLLGKNVLVIPDKQDQEEKDGILIPSTQLKYGTVEEVGIDVEHIKKGDYVLLPKGELTELDHNGKHYVILPDDMILAIL